MGLVFKNAFKCKKCPGNNQQPLGCPMWWEIILTNDATMEQKVEKGCGYQLLPQLIVMNYKEARHSTYASYDMRNKVVSRLSKVITAVKEQLKLDIPEEITEPLQIEEKKNEIS
jgi:hypothetical protein